MTNLSRTVNTEIWGEVGMKNAEFMPGFESYSHFSRLEAGCVSLSEAHLQVRWSRGCPGRARTITVCVHPHPTGSCVEHGTPTLTPSSPERALLCDLWEGRKHLMSIYVSQFYLFIHIIIRKRSCFQLLENERSIPLGSNLPRHRLPLMGTSREGMKGRD